MEKFTVIPKIKRFMKKDKKISKDQIKDYDRRIERSPVLRVHLELLQQAENQRIKDRDEIRELRDEVKELNKHLSCWCQNYKRAKGKLIEEFGKKSYEYQIVFGKH